MSEPWCVILGSRLDGQHRGAKGERDPSDRSRPERASSANAMLAATLRRAATVTSLDRVAAVFASPPDRWRENPLKHVDTANLFVQPEHKGTAYEVLFALLMVEKRAASETPVIFLPPDHLVDDEEVVSNALMTMAEWIVDEPAPVYLLGAVPQGPHDKLGYIVPWHDAMLTPAGVYEFVERPDIHRARQLISAGGLWNTFIFGGTISALLKLFQPRFDATIAEFRAALQGSSNELELARTYAHLRAADFSQEMLAKQSCSLNVLRLLRCGWWPLKSPTLSRERRA